MLFIILSIIFVIYIILEMKKLNRQIFMLGNISSIFSYLFFKEYKFI